MTKSGGVSVPTSDGAGDALLHHSIDSAGYTRCSGTSNNIDDAENDLTGDAEVITTGMDFCAISSWKVSNQRLCSRWLEALGAADVPRWMGDVPVSVARCFVLAAASTFKKPLGRTVRGACMEPSLLSIRAATAATA